MYIDYLLVLAGLLNNGHDCRCVEKPLIAGPCESARSSPFERAIIRRGLLPSQSQLASPVTDNSSSIMTRRQVIIRCSTLLQRCSQARSSCPPPTGGVIYYFASRVPVLSCADRALSGSIDIARRSSSAPLLVHTARRSRSRQIDIAGTKGRVDGEARCDIWFCIGGCRRRRSKSPRLRCASGRLGIDQFGGDELGRRLDQAVAAPVSEPADGLFGQCRAASTRTARTG